MKTVITLELPDREELLADLDPADRDAVRARIDLLVAAAAEIAPALEQIRQLDLALSKAVDPQAIGHRRVRWPQCWADHVARSNAEIEAGTANLAAARSVAEVKEAAAASERAAVSSARAEERRIADAGAPLTRSQIMSGHAFDFPRAGDRRR